MTSLLIVAHAPLASSLQALAQHVYADCSAQLVAVDIAPSTGLQQAQAEITKAMLGLPGPEILVLTDVFGATPCNAALAAAQSLPAQTTARVVAGVNVPMLWRTLCYSDKTLDDLVARALAGASQGVMHVAVPRRQNQPTAPASHDQDHHHHQQ
jgi:mannose PTS system EIIA component